MQSVDVHEHTTTLLPFNLTDADERVLEDPVLRKYFQPRYTRKGGWTVHVRGIAGSLHLTNGILQVRPKIEVSGEMLLGWLHYVTNRDHPVHAHPKKWDVEGTYFTDMVVRAFLRECRTLTAGQLRKDYQRHESVDGVLRGKLDVVRQATRQFGMADRLHLHTFDRTADIWENQVCGAALHHAARTADCPELRAEAKQLAARFPSCKADVARKILARAQHNPVNHRYRLAHVWAEVLLRSGGVADLFLPQELVGDSHLLIMHVLWERLVHRMVDSEKIEPVHVKRPHATNKPFQPDAVARSAGVRLAIDAKYKDYDNRAVSPSDIHQLLTYASAYRVPGTDVLRAVIVHPSVFETERRDIAVTFGGKQLAVIDLVGVDVSKQPEENSIVLNELLQS